jgi:DNA-binding PadR family transcriptional regulator
MRAVRRRDWLDKLYRLTPEGRAVLDRWGDQ